MSKCVLPVFPSGSFVVGSLTFRYLIHIEFSVYMVLQNVLRSLYNLMQKAYTLKTINCWWKLKKMTQTDGKIDNVNGLEESILLK